MNNYQSFSNNYFFSVQLLLKLPADPFYIFETFMYKASNKETNQMTIYFFIRICLSVFIKENGKDKQIIYSICFSARYCSYLQ